MTKYKSKDDIYCWDDGILINKLNIHDSKVLEQKEKDISTAKALVYDLKSNGGNFSLKHYLTLHKFLFGDVYEWAGKVRKITLSKNGTMFAPWYNIESTWAEQVDSELKNTGNLLKLNNLYDKIISLAKIWGEINAIHPCREGNGRTTRLFLSELASFNNIQLQWKLLSKEENLEGSKKSLRCDYSVNIKLLRKIIK